MKKVAFFAEILIEDFDGASRTMFQLINRINKKQFEYLFIYGKGPDQFRDFQSYKVPSLRIPANEDYSLAIPQLTKFSLDQALDRFAPEVIHIATPSLLGFYALNYAKRRNIPVLTIYHTHFISYITYYLKNVATLVKPTQQWIKKIMNNFYNRCDTVYVPSSSMSQELTGMGIQADRLSLWQRGIDTRLFNPEKKDKEYIQKITQNQQPNILFASRLVWEKNIRTLIQIYKLLKEQELPYNLIIAGDGTAKDEAQKEMPEAIFLGKMDHQQLSTLYASADIFVFTSVSETYGNVVIEAMASGLPCIIADGGGSANLVEHGITGFKCKPNDPLAYIDHINKLISSSSLREDMISHGLNYAQTLDWDKLSDQYFEDIKSLGSITNSSLAWAN